MIRNLYLAWGGEQGAKPALLNGAGIARAVEHAHYSGDQPFAHLAKVTVSGDEATLARVALRRDTRRIDADDMIDDTYNLIDAAGAVLDRLTVRLDGRA